MGKRLFEIRSNITGGRIARVLFAVVDEEMVLLHGFIKKSQRTPARELNLALKRLKEYEQ
jgi:phage-related protein